MTSSLPPLAQAWSGALGSAAANSISYPLDLVATKLQTTTSKKIRGLQGAVRLIKHVLRTDGMAGLYDGLGADTASTLTSKRQTAASRASLTQTLKHAIVSTTPSTLLSVPAELAVGFIAGVVSRAASTPLSVITVRMQTNDDDDDDDDDGKTSDKQASSPSWKGSSVPGKSSPGFCEALQSIYSEEGFFGFWAGFQPTLPLCLTPALTLLLFQLLSRLRIPGRKNPAPPRPTVFGAFFSGAIANALAVVILYPLLLAKVRVQASRTHAGTSRSASVIDVWTTAIKDEGWLGLYQGITVQLVKGFVNQGVTMLVKQRIEHAAIRLYTRSKRN
ncbi:mitochondrial carrier [Trametes meyenii]|nr:mitochondrial carrier [Trametes meyenii]